MNIVQRASRSCRSINRVSKMSFHCGELSQLPSRGGVYILVGDPLERGVIVEPEVSCVNDVVGAGLLCKLVKRPKIPYFSRHISLGGNVAAFKLSRQPTTDVGNTQHTYTTGLDHATMPGMEIRSAHAWGSTGLSSTGAVGTVRKELRVVVIVVGARLGLQRQNSAGKIRLDMRRVYAVVEIIQDCFKGIMGSSQWYSQKPWTGISKL